MKRKILSVLLSLTFLFSGIVGVVQAQNDSSTTGNGFRVSPVREEFTIDKGKSLTTTITVENVTGGPLVAHPIVNDFDPSPNENGEPQILLDGEASSTGNSFQSLVQDLPNVPLKPGEKKDIKVTISVSNSANAGGYYGAIRFSPNEVTNDRQVALTASVGVIYLIKVPGDISEKLELLTLAAGTGDGYSSFFLSSPENTVVRLKNTGTIHLQPFGKIIVKDWRGKVVSEQEMNNTDPRANVLPSSVRRFDTPLGAKLSFGRYKIEANLGYGTDTSQLITASATIWVIPFWFVIALAVLIFIIVVAIYTSMRRRKKNRRYR